MMRKWEARDQQTNARRNKKTNYIHHTPTTQASHKPNAVRLSVSSATHQTQRASAMEVNASIGALETHRDFARVLGKNTNVSTQKILYYA